MMAETDSDHEPRVATAKDSNNPGEAQTFAGTNVPLFVLTLLITKKLIKVVGRFLPKLQELSLSLNLIL
jgi:hypothetical protein